MRETPEAILETNATDRAHSRRNVKSGLCANAVLDSPVLGQSLGIDEGFAALWACVRALAAIHVGRLPHAVRDRLEKENFTYGCRPFRLVGHEFNPQEWIEVEAGQTGGSTAKLHQCN